MTRLYILEVDTRAAEGMTVVSYPVVSERIEKAILYQYNDKETRYYGVRNMWVPQIVDHGTRARCVFWCSDAAAAEEIRMRTLLLIDALHAEGQRRAVNLSRMEDEL